MKTRNPFLASISQPILMAKSLASPKLAELRAEAG
jgi:hypothetical protein